MIATQSPLVVSALTAAVRAPSPYNTQPWLFEVGPGGIDVVLDESRILKVSDPDGREARVACGAALKNIELTIRAAGHACDVELLPDRTRPELLAHAEPGPRRRPSAEELRLEAAVRRRFSNRRPFTGQAVPPRVRQALVRAAREDGAGLVLLDEARLLTAVAALVRRADHLQQDDPEFQAELRAWTRGGGGDGVPDSAGGPRSAGGLLPVRHIAQHGQERPYEQDPLVAVLTTNVDVPFAQVRAGQALQRVLLTATDAGLSASFLSQPVEIPSIRAELRTLLSGSYPQTVLRLGYGFPGASTPRRPPFAITRSRP